MVGWWSMVTGGCWCAVGQSAMPPSLIASPLCLMTLDCISDLLQDHLAMSVLNLMPPGMAASALLGLVAPP
jgi:hypothetical protein